MKTLITIIFCVISFTTIAQNQNLSNGVVFDGEPYLAINPNNSQHLVVAWMGWKFNNSITIKIRTSFDAGQTWSTTTNIPHIVSGYQSADPSLAFDNNGNLFLCFIDYKISPVAGAVYVVKSTNGGLNWGTPIEVINVNSNGTQQPVDRPWMSIDNSGGTNDGNIYVTTMNPNVFGPVPAPYHPYLIRSIDGGASFEPWKYLDTTGWLAGSLIPQPMPTNCVSANGTFYAVYPSYVPAQNLYAQYIIASSNNAGNSFNHNQSLVITNANTDTLPKKGYKLIADPANQNHLVFAYPNFDNGDLDVYIAESLDAGLTWSTPVRVNDDPIANNRMQDLIWADFDTDGDLLVTWRDRRNAPDSTYKVSTEIYAAVRWKTSSSFSANFTLSDSSVAYNSVLENSGNDFMSCKMINDTVYAVWGDTRDGNLNIWFTRKDLSGGNVAVAKLATNIEPISFYPNPTNKIIHINLGNNNLKDATLQITNVLGKVIYHKNITTQNSTIDVSKYKNGVYFIRFSNKKGSKVLQLIKE